MVRCDRQTFMDLASGLLMIRDSRGRITNLGDQIHAHNAIEAAERKEEVILTVNGKDFSRIVDFEEIKI